MCLHTSHIDAFRVPVSEIERMAMGSFSVSCPVAFFHLLMCIPGLFSPSIPSSLLTPILLWAGLDLASSPIQYQDSAGKVASLALAVAHLLLLLAR